MALVLLGSGSTDGRRTEIGLLPTKIVIVQTIEITWMIGGWWSTASVVAQTMARHVLDQPEPALTGLGASSMTSS